MSARTAIQISDRVISIISNLPSGSKVDLLMLTSLLCFREEDDALYDEIVSGDFERTVPKGDSVKTVYLSEFLKSYLSNINRPIRFKLEPKKYGCFNFNHNRNFPNEYPEGIYQVSLHDYFEAIFSDHLAEKKRGLGILALGGRSRTPEQNEVQKVDAKLYELVSKTHHSGEFYYGDAAPFRLKALYLKGSYNKKNNHYYKDLVELASALDWMDEDFK